MIVNQSFVHRALEDRNPIGLRVRYVTTNPDRTSPRAAARGPWYTIVGTVRDLGTIHDDPGDLAGLYHPAAPAAVFPMHLVVHVSGAPASFASRLRAVAASVDLALRVDDIQPLDRVGASTWNEFDFLFRLLVLMSSIAVLLSLAGIYAILSFTISRRTREIGVRVALGAPGCALSRRCSRARSAGRCGRRGWRWSSYRFSRVWSLGCLHGKLR